MNGCMVNETVGGLVNVEMPKLGVVLNQYKRIVTKNARKINSLWDWQSQYHDHIIRNKTEFYKIRNYITNNPKKLNMDRFNH